LYLTWQNREININQFFLDENESQAPSLSHERHIRLGTKSDIAGLLQSLLDSTTEHNLNFNAAVYDGAALINSPTDIKIIFINFSPFVQSLYTITKRLR